MSESIYIMMKSKEKILYAKGLALIGKWNYKTFIKYDYYIKPIYLEKIINQIVRKTDIQKVFGITEKTKLGENYLHLLIEGKDVTRDKILKAIRAKDYMISDIEKINGTKYIIEYTLKYLGKDFSCHNIAV